MALFSSSLSMPVGLQLSLFYYLSKNINGPYAFEALQIYTKVSATNSGSDPQSSQPNPKNPLNPQNHQLTPKFRIHNPYEISTSLNLSCSPTFENIYKYASQYLIKSYSKCLT